MYVRTADMSLPPEQRHRKQKQTRTKKAVPAQMDHASNPRARKKQRQGEKRMHGRARW
jgi:hypothetical protein